MLHEQVILAGYAERENAVCAAVSERVETSSHRLLLSLRRLKVTTSLIGEESLSPVLTDENP